MNTHKLYKAFNYFQTEINRLENYKNQPDKIHTYAVSSMGKSDGSFGFEEDTIETLTTIIESTVFADDNASITDARPIHHHLGLEKGVLAPLDAKWESLVFMEEKLRGDCERKSGTIKRHSDLSSTFDIDHSVLVICERYDDYLYLDKAHDALKIAKKGLKEGSDTRSECVILLDQIETVLDKMAQKSKVHPPAIREIIPELASSIRRGITSEDSLTKFAGLLAAKGEDGFKDAEDVSTCDKEARKITECGPMDFLSLLKSYKDYFEEVIEKNRIRRFDVLRGIAKWCLVAAFLYFIPDALALSKDGTGMQTNQFISLRVTGLIVGSFSFVGMLRGFTDFSDNRNRVEKSPVIDCLFMLVYVLLCVLVAAFLAGVDYLALQYIGFNQAYPWLSLLAVIPSLLVLAFDKLGKKCECYINRIIPLWLAAFLSH